MTAADRIHALADTGTQQRHPLYLRTDAQPVPFANSNEGER